MSSVITLPEIAQLTPEQKKQYDRFLINLTRGVLLTYDSTRGGA